SSASIDLTKYLDKKVHVEHIFPNTPTELLKAEFDKPLEYGDYKERLGNLTLLEMSINTSIQQNFFPFKALEYQKSNFLLTKTIGAPFTVGVNTQPNRATAALLSWKKWDSEAINARQAGLVQLAWQVWGITVPIRPKEASVAATNLDAMDKVPVEAPVLN